MHIFEVVIALLLGGAGLAAIARRVGAPYPALLAFAGAVLALLPGVPEVVLDPELALTLFVAPVLLDAAFDASPRDLRANWRSIAGLAVGAVAVTVVVVALVARALVPGMPWAVAIALGAIVAPPDAAAATTVLRQLRPPHRLMVILEGESLFNDASALLAYRLAVGAAVGGVVVEWDLAGTLLVATVGSVVLGLVLARVSLHVIGRIGDVATSVIVQFTSTFGVWLLAERLELSGILTTVVYAMAIARRASEVVPARIRVPSYAVWEVAVFVLNVLAFILVGLQLKSIAGRLDLATEIEYFRFAAVICGAAIAARFLWVLAASAYRRWRQHRGRAASRKPDALAVGSKVAVVVGWSGMRGIVTLAAALALPTTVAGGGPFPYRDLILVTAFGVVLGTLVVQGLTLRRLLAWMRLTDDMPVEREVRLARIETLRAGLMAIDGAPGDEVARVLRQRYELRLRRAEAALQARTEVRNGDEPPDAAGGPGGGPDSATFVRNVIAAERQRLSALRAEGTIGDAAFQRVQEELDLAELDLERFLQIDAPED